MSKDYYNTKKIRKFSFDKDGKDRKIPVWMILGARRIGKTQRFKGEAIGRYLDGGERTMWMRNKAVEMEKDGFRLDFLNMADDFRLENGKLLKIPEEFETRLDGVYADKGASDCLIPFQSLNTYSNRRGNMAKGVTNIVFDEFMPEDRKYPKGCFTAVQSLAMTILEGNPDAKLYMLSNYISAGNPYFAGWRVVPSDMDVTIYDDKGIGIEVCRGYRSAVEDDSPWRKVFKAGRYQDYESDAEDPMLGLIKKRPEVSTKQGYSVYINGNKYGSWIGKDAIYWGPDNSPDGYRTYVSDKKQVSDKYGMIPSMFRKDLKRQFELNSLRYHDINTMQDVLSIIFEDYA